MRKSENTFQPSLQTFFQSFVPETASRIVSLVCITFFKKLYTVFNNQVGSMCVHNFIKKATAKCCILVNDVS